MSLARYLGLPASIASCLGLLPLLACDLGFPMSLARNLGILWHFDPLALGDIRRLRMDEEEDDFLHLHNCCSQPLLNSVQIYITFSSTTNKY